MILTGKTEVDFIKWASYNYGEDIGDLAMMREVYRKALMIEFFDSVGIYIQIHNVCDDWWFRVKSKTKTIKSEKYNEYKNRQEATIQAIKKANDIYNENNSM